MTLKESKIWPKWRIKITEEGEMLFSDLESWESFKVPYYGKEMVLVLKTPTKDRSRQEEKFYHAVVVRMVAEAMDISREEAHQLLKSLHLRVEGRTKGGVRYERTMSTTELSDRAYREYWEKCIKWAALPTSDEGLGQTSGLELFIPMPNECDYEDA